MDSSKSSATSLSISENESSYSDPITASNTLTKSSYLAQCTQSRAPTTKRFIMADETLQQQQIKAAGHYQGVRKNIALAPSQSQFFMDNNNMNRAFYYNEQQQQQGVVNNQSFMMPTQNYQRYPQPYRQNVEFAAFQQQQMYPAEYYMPRYTKGQSNGDLSATRDGLNYPAFGATSHVLESHMAQKPTSLPGYMPNNNRSRVFAVVDSYGSRYNVNYPPGTQPPFYTNPGFDGNSSQPNVNTIMDMPRTPVMETKLMGKDRVDRDGTDNPFLRSDTQSIGQMSHVEETLQPLAANWGMSGGFGNTFNSQKYYREQDVDDQPFYPLEFGGGQKESNGGLATKVGRCGGKKCKLAGLLTSVGGIVLVIVVVAVLMGAFPDVVFEKSSLFENNERLNTSNETSFLENIFREIGFNNNEIKESQDIFQLNETYTEIPVETTTSSGTTILEKLTTTATTTNEDLPTTTTVTDKFVSEQSTTIVSTTEKPAIERPTTEVTITEMPTTTSEKSTTTTESPIIERILTTTDKLITQQPTTSTTMQTTTTEKTITNTEGTNTVTQRTTTMPEKPEVESFVTEQAIATTEGVATMKERTTTITEKEPPTTTERPTTEESTTTPQFTTLITTEGLGTLLDITSNEVASALPTSQLS